MRFATVFQHRGAQAEAPALQRQQIDTPHHHVPAQQRRVQPLHPQKIRDGRQMLRRQQRHLPRAVPAGAVAVAQDAAGRDQRAFLNQAYRHVAFGAQADPFNTTAPHRRREQPGQG